MPTDEEMQAVRELLDRIAERAGRDVAFAAEMKANPGVALKSAGVPDWAVAGLTRELELAEVEGHWFGTSLYMYAYAQYVESIMSRRK